MAIVRGPLHSDRASGSVAKALTFRHTNGQATCRKIGRRSAPLSEEQTLHHAAFSMLSAAWRTASAADRLTWAALADPDKISHYAAYMRYNFARMADGLATTTVYPPAEGPVVAARVSPGTPPASPDCSGDYVIIGQYNGQPLYSRIPDFDYTISYDASESMWLLMPVSPPPSPAMWNGTSTPAGTYFANFYCVGNPVVTVL